MRINRKFANVDNTQFIAYIAPYIHQKQSLQVYIMMCIQYGILEHLMNAQNLLGVFQACPKWPTKSTKFDARGHFVPVLPIFHVYSSNRLVLSIHYSAQSFWDCRVLVSPRFWSRITSVHHRIPYQVFRGATPIFGSGTEQRKNVF